MSSLAPDGDIQICSPNQALDCPNEFHCELNILYGRYQCCKPKKTNEFACPETTSVQIHPKTENPIKCVSDKDCANFVSTHPSFTSYSFQCRPNANNQYVDWKARPLTRSVFDILKVFSLLTFRYIQACQSRMRLKREKLIYAGIRTHWRQLSVWGDRTKHERYQNNQETLVTCQKSGNFPDNPIYGGVCCEANDLKTLLKMTQASRLELSLLSGKYWPA